MKKFFIILSILINSHAIKNLSFETYLITINKDIRTKSYMGWARLINNPSKRLKYHIYLNKDEIKKYTDELKKLNSVQKKENTLWKRYYFLFS